MADNSEQEPKKEEQSEFKKPVLIGRIGKLPKKAKSEPEKVVEEKKVEEPKKNDTENDAKKSSPPVVNTKELSAPIPYKEPKWSGLCPDGSDYGLEVLKSGMIVERTDLTTKPFYVFGRLTNCDVVMAHPTISRHHAVLQYKAFAEDGEPPSGWYLYDLGSTHGTFLNKERLKSSHYTRVRVGHQIKFGASSRTYIMLGPDFDCEGESELSVTDIKKRALEMKLERDRMIQEAIEQREKERVEEERKREEQGIDWGMGEDAEEETDLSENPYAATVNEELYLDDPKKTLRGYYEREGFELTYDCQEKSAGQFICKVELPIDDARGKPVIAEAIHRGKKKDAVVACALEACRILDRAGLLRQAKHESRRRKQRDWSADDYYDSDEDTFLDRTGSVERKRRARMERLGAAAGDPRGPLTYDDLLKQSSELESKIASEEKVLEGLRARAHAPVAGEGDELDQYMVSLAHGTMAQKAEISKAKMNIQKLKTELSKTQRLAELARPAHLPPLVKKDDKKMSVKMANSVVYGKRIRLKEDTEKRPKIRKPTTQQETEFVEEMDSDEETDFKTEENAEKTEENRVKEKDGGGRGIEDDTIESDKDEKRVFGPMRPPDDYVIPEDYFDQVTDRDLPEITDE